MPTRVIRGVYRYVSGHCDMAMHTECYPAFGTTFECECDCHAAPEGTPHE